MDWYNRGLGFRLSTANTFFLVDDNKIRAELLAKKIVCEIPDCTVQAVGYLKDGIPAYCCQRHLDIFNEGSARSKALIRKLKEDIMDVLELHKQIYTNMRQGQDMQQVTIVKQPGVPFMSSLVQKEAEVAVIKKSNILPLPLVLPF